MNKTDFLNANRNYIDSLINGTDHALSAEEWREWILKESKDYGTQYTTDEIAWIIDELPKEGGKK